MIFLTFSHSFSQSNKYNHSFQPNNPETRVAGAPDPNSAIFTQWNPLQEGRLRRHSTGRVRNPQSNGLQPMQLSVFPQNIELNATDKDSPYKMPIMGNTT